MQNSYFVKLIEAFESTSEVHQDDQTKLFSTHESKINRQFIETS